MRDAWNCIAVAGGTNGFINLFSVHFGSRLGFFFCLRFCCARFGFRSSLCCFCRSRCCGFCRRCGSRCRLGFFHRSFTVFIGKTPYISSHNMQFVFIQEMSPSRHLAAASVGNGFDNGFLRTAPQPYVISQVRTQTLDTLPLISVASETVGRRTAEQGLSARGTFLIILTFGFRKRHHIMRNVFYAFLT